MEELLSGLPQDSAVLNIIVVLLLLTLIPTLLMAMTSFTRVLIILSFTRSALGTQQTPPNQVLIGIALLTFFIMAPVLSPSRPKPTTLYEGGAQRAGGYGARQGPLRGSYSRRRRPSPEPEPVPAWRVYRPSTLEEIPLSVLIPSFVTGS